MKKRFECDGYKIDRKSQKFLLLLHQETHPLTAGDAVEWLDCFSQNQEVHHRAEDFLMPAGLVEREPEHERHEWAPWKYTLTDDGERAMDDSGAELFDKARSVAEAIEAIEEIRKEVSELHWVADEAKKEAQSATDSVQGYRQTVNYWKEQVQEVDDKVESRYESIEDWAASEAYVRVQLKDTQKEIEDARSEEIGDVLAEVEANEQQLCELEEQLVSLESQVEDPDCAVKQLIRSFRCDLNDLEERVKELEEGNQDSGLFSWA